MANPSNDSIPLNSRDILTVAIEGGLMLIISFVAIMGNLLICFVTFINPRFHTVSNVFVVSLAICYTFAACLVLPTAAGGLLAGRWPFGQVLCDIQGFTFLNFIWVSLLTLTNMAASRYLKVTHVAFYRKLFTLDRSIGMVMTLWVLAAALLVTQMAFGSAIFRFSSEKSICYMSSSNENQREKNINSVITIVLYTVLFIVSVIAWYSIRRQNTYNHSSPQLERTNAKPEIELKTLLEERRANRVLLAMMVEVLLLWLAAITIQRLELSTQSASFSRQVHLATTFLWSIVPALHPITYGILSKPFAREAIRVLPQLPRSSLRRNKVHAEQAEQAV